MKLEHIGIAVKELETADRLYTTILGLGPYKHETVESEAVNVSFFQTGSSKIELLESIDEQSAIAKFIAKRGEGLHHIAFEVEDIQAEMERLKGEGYRLLNEQPRKGADNKWICFIHPKDSGGVLIELCEERK